MTDYDTLFFNLQERLVPYFTTEEVQNLLDVHGDVWTASYYGCLMKAQQNDAITLPGGLVAPSNSAYWTALADRYKLLMPSDYEENGKTETGAKNFMSRVDGGR
jgi:hypothetical protein